MTTVIPPSIDGLVKIRNSAAYHEWIDGVDHSARSELHNRINSVLLHCARKYGRELCGEAAGSCRAAFDIGGDLIVKVPRTTTAIASILFEAGSEWVDGLYGLDRDILDQIRFVPNVLEHIYGIPVLLCEKLLYCGFYAYGVNDPLPDGIPDPPHWALQLPDGGQVGWSPTRKEWFAFDVN
jgi:hypothetical protein